MSTYLIPDEVSFAGEWWLPSDASCKIAGTLAWSKNKATLALHDSFTPLRSGPLVPSSQTQPVIHGITTKGNAVSVLEALCTGGTMAFGGAAFRRPESFVSSLVVVGAHADKQTLYSEMRARIPGMQLWLGTGRIDETFIPGDGKRIAGVIYHVHLDHGECIEIPSLEMTLSWGLDRQLSSDRQTAISVNSTGQLRIVPKQPQTLDWYFAQLQKATILLSLVAGAPMTADEVAVKLVDGDSDISLLVGWAGAKFCPYRNPHEFFLLRQAMGVDFGAVLQAWYRLDDGISKPSQLALSVLASDGLWTHVEFLLLMQALEGFHRVVAADTHIPNPPPTDRLSNNTPSDQETPQPTARIKPNAKRGKKASLGKRITNLANRLDPSLRQLIFGGDGTVPNSWVITRNYYTHWIPQLRSRALDTVGMYYANVRLRHFLRVLYLDFMGIPQAAIAKALDGTNSESQHLLQLNHPSASFGHVEVRPANTTESEAEEPHQGA